MIDSLLEKNLLPDIAIRIGIRRLLRQRLREERVSTPAEQNQRLEAFAADLRTQPIAINTQESKEQHYEVPTAFFELVLGRHLKYSSCCFDLSRPPARDRAHEQLDDAAARMLALTVERAGIRNGDRVLELGCGWGSLSLFMAERFPNSRITGVKSWSTGWSGP